MTAATHPAAALAVTRWPYPPPGNCTDGAGFHVHPLVLLQAICAPSYTEHLAAPVHVPFTSASGAGPGAGPLAAAGPGALITALQVVPAAHAFPAPLPPPNMIAGPGVLYGLQMPSDS